MKFFGFVVALLMAVAYFGVVSAQEPAPQCVPVCAFENSKNVIVNLKYHPELGAGEEYCDKATNIKYTCSKNYELISSMCNA